MTIHPHALDRIAERLTSTERAEVSRLLSEYQSTAESVGIRVLRLQAARHEAWGQTSNGDTVVAIARHGTVETVMLRRSGQPFDRAALNVKKLETL